MPPRREPAPDRDDDPDPGPRARDLAAPRQGPLGDDRQAPLPAALRARRGRRPRQGPGPGRARAREAGDLVLDADLASVGEVRLDGQAITPRRVHDHLVIPGAGQGKRTIEVAFEAALAPTGTPLTLFHDDKDGEDYLYTLVVPADAHRLFPCFDQPDLKGRFTLELVTPAAWVAVANGERTAEPEEQDGRRTWRFAETKPLSTYLFAFAAGPFAVVDGPTFQIGGHESSRGMRLYLRESARNDRDVSACFSLHGAGLAWLQERFAVPYPFGKLDLVLCPGFPYSGMEHAGAIFYRESALVFDREPTQGERLRRSTLIYHELTHQWFGNLVTMRWFDDLWLKEGFATFLGYQALEALEPEQGPWLRFLQKIKPRAYAIDGTPGTTPIWQELANLDQAKSQYGAIVYNKAPAVLRELEHRIGPEVFAKGVTDFLTRHAYANATWEDLLASFERAGAEGLGPWSAWWILGRGLPILEPALVVEDGRIESLSVRQRSSLGDVAEAAWPLDLVVLLGRDETGRGERLRVRLSGPRAVVEGAAGKPAPRFVLLNPDDVAYGRFLLDEASAAELCDLWPKMTDPLLRSVAHAALYETFREATLDPRAFLAASDRALATEADAQARDRVLGAARRALRTLDDAARAPLAKGLRDRVLAQLREGRYAGDEAEPFGHLCRLGRDDRTLELCRGLLRLEPGVPGWDPSVRELFEAASYLLACGDNGVRDWLLALETAGAWVPGLGAKEPSPALAKALDRDLPKLLYVARAASPAAAVKQAYWDTWQHAERPPEQWIEQSLDVFHWPGQGDVTLRYLRQALDRLEWVQKHRKIFFMPAWLDAFVNGHDSREALDIVEGFLREEKETLPQDIIRKLEQSLDELERTVRIRERWTR
ncbi:MAG: M1 family aminopeptidase [Planctomycetota bacterium]